MFTCVVPTSSPETLRLFCLCWFFALSLWNGFACSVFYFSFPLPLPLTSHYNCASLVVAYCTYQKNRKKKLMIGVFKTQEHAERVGWLIQELFMWCKKLQTCKLVLTWAPLQSVWLCLEWLLPGKDLCIQHKPWAQLPVQSPEAASHLWRIFISGVGWVEWITFSKYLSLTIHKGL